MGEIGIAFFIFFLSLSTCELLTPNKESPEALKMSFALNSILGAVLSRFTKSAETLSSYNKFKYDSAAGKLCVSGWVNQFIVSLFFIIKHLYANIFHFGQFIIKRFE